MISNSAALSRAIAQRSSAFLFMLNTDAGSHVGEISDVAETTTQVTPNWFNLSNTEKYWVHESKNIEGHLLGREHANSVHLNPLNNHIRLIHESGAMSPPKRLFRIAHPAMMMNLPNDCAYPSFQKTNS